MPPQSTHEALILAAGRGERMRGQGLPKPLIPFLGLTLLERSMATLKRAGIRRVVVVTGHQARQVANHARNRARALKLECAIIEADDWERGNGASALAAWHEMGERFLMVMCDHVFDPKLLRDLASVPPNDGLLLAVDRRLDNPLVDRGDVTRVRMQDRCITEIGKGLERFDAWDVGAFHCSRACFEALAACDGSVTDAVRILARERRARVVDIGDAFWADLDDADALVRAETEWWKRQGGKAHDGPVARWLNRPLSIRLSRRLLARGASPMQMTVTAFLVAALAALCIALPGRGWLALGGILAQIASILDGCDGEIARATLRESAIGGWMDAVLDRYADTLLIGAFTFHAMWHEQGGMAAAAGMAALSGALINSYTADKYDGWMQRRRKRQRFRLGRDIRILLMTAFALADAPLALLWLIAGLMHAENLRRMWVMRH